MSNQPRSILVVDDEPEGFDVVEGILFNEGYTLHYVANGLVALEWLEKQTVDVILLDVMMPQMDGIEVCRRIKSHESWQHIPIIMLTALSSSVSLARCLEAGANDFLSKPVNGVELRARVRSMLRVKEQYETLQTLLQLRKDLADMIVHDLRSPLASIRLACEILKHQLIPPDSQKRVQQIAIAGQQLESLIDSLLTIAKLEADRMQLNYTQVDVVLLGKQVLEDFQQIAAQKQIMLIGEFSPDALPIAADRVVLRRVLDNLLSNAVKFSPRHSQVQLKVSQPTPTRIRLQVADQGNGVSPELRQSIFERYEVGQLFQGVAQTGLGLAFCKMAIDAHGGKITIEDNSPKGTIFVVELSLG